MSRAKVRLRRQKFCANFIASAKGKNEKFYWMKVLREADLGNIASSSPDYSASSSNSDLKFLLSLKFNFLSLLYFILNFLLKRIFEST
jgi:hypothetical protein